VLGSGDGGSFGFARPGGVLLGLPGACLGFGDLAGGVVLGGADVAGRVVAAGVHPGAGGPRRRQLLGLSAVQQVHLLAAKWRSLDCLKDIPGA
jgi:hypothetical protein